MARMLRHHLHVVFQQILPMVVLEVAANMSRFSTPRPQMIATRESPDNTQARPPPSGSRGAPQGKVVVMASMAQLIPSDVRFRVSPRLTQAQVPLVWFLLEASTRPWTLRCTVVLVRVVAL